MSIARPLKSSVRVEEHGGDLVLRRRTGSLATGAIVALFLIGWSVACAYGVDLATRQPTPARLVFAVSIGYVLILRVSVFLWIVLGVEHLCIGPDGITLRSCALVTLKTRHIPLNEIRGIAEYSVVVGSDDTRLRKTLFGMKIDTAGSPLLCFKGTDAIERLWLADRLLVRLQRLSPRRSIPMLEKAVPKVEVLSLQRSVPEPPPDSMIQLEDEWDRMEFVRRGRLSRALQREVGFTNLYDSLGGAFLLQLFREFLWVVFLFLVPLELIVFVVILSWCARLYTLLLVERWSIGTSEIAARVSVLGVGWPRRIRASDLGRIELRKNTRTQLNDYSNCAWDHTGDTPHTVALVSRSGQDLLVIDDLTEGEGRWLGYSLHGLLKGSVQEQETVLSAAGRESEPLWDREFDA